MNGFYSFLQSIIYKKVIVFVSTYSTHHNGFTGVTYHVTPNHISLIQLHPPKSHNHTAINFNKLLKTPNCPHSVIYISIDKIDAIIYFP